MDRDDMLARLEGEDAPWEVLIVGGGATGLGTALEAAARGYRTLLLEQHDFAKGTSSRSTKLVHGGVRYLQQGDVSLVREALVERARLRRNAPHLVRKMPFVVPCYRWWERFYYGTGLKLYDLLAGRQNLERSSHLSRSKTLRRLPTLAPEDLRGGVLYFDGQFDDARLAVNLAQTAVEQDGTLLNYMPVTGLIKTGGQVAGVKAQDRESGRRYELEANVVINATGVFADHIRRMDDPEAETMIRPSQGTHLVLDQSFLPGGSALMIPNTEDGRVLFAIPWNERVVLGTTDTSVQELSLEPRPLAEELDFLLAHAERYLTRRPTPEDVRSAYAGLRPLVDEQKGEGSTSSLSRDHVLHVSESGLVTITGGKWTTYRQMAEDAVDRAAAQAALPERPSATKDLRLHGGGAEPTGPLRRYGSDAPALRTFLQTDSTLDERLHPELPYRAGEVVWAARHEMARTVEDVLARRTRALLLDARASMDAAPRVAEFLAEELGRSDDWVEEQVADYRELARGYVPATGDVPT